MTGTTGQRVAQAAAVAGFITLTACGGGGGGGVGSTPPPPIVSTPTPTPAPAPAPTPSPAPTPTPAPAPTAANYDTSEYRATVGAVSMNALSAYTRGATGAGIKVGVVDTGIDLESPEFPGRISSASVNVAGGTSADDEDGHGTAVAFTIAGRRNDAGTHGVAFDAMIVALRADALGSCAGTTPGNDDCTFFDSAIARGIDAAVAAGARVVNLSLGGDAFSNVALQAINRATTAGVVIVISAGNGYTKDPVAGANPEASAQVANNDAIARGLVIIAGSVGASDGISSFSNRAGNSAAHYLTAVGERVRAPDHTNTPFLWSGTSFSAPQISAAVALLAQAFPNLSGRQIVDLLYTTARDAGASGDDAVYGQGVLDLTRAFQPVGTSSVAGMRSAVSLTNNGMLSAPMGDARQAGLGAVILDGYDRAFAIDLARTINRAGPQRTLGGLVTQRTRSIIARSSDLTLAVTVAPGRDHTRIERMLLTGAQADAARALAGSVSQRLGRRASFALGFATGGGALTAQLAGRRAPAFLIARDPDASLGFDSSARSAGAVRIERGGTGLTAAAESGQVRWQRRSDIIALDRRSAGSGYQRFAVGLDRRFGPLLANDELSRLAEQRTLLGARLGDGLGGARATSWFVDIGARLELGGGWTAGGSFRQGRTRGRLMGGITGSGNVITRAWAADVARDGLLLRGDTIGFRVAQPLRVSRGGLDIALPTYWDYTTLAATQWTTQRLNLAPTGRELDYEWRYAVPLGAGVFASNLFWRSQPGNFASLPADRGAVVRYSLGF